MTAGNQWTVGAMVASGFAVILLTGQAAAQTVAPMPAAPILPRAVFPEVGIPQITVQGGGSQPSGTTTSSTGTVQTPGSSSSAMQIADDAAQAQGINMDAMTAFCTVESTCQNIPNAGGTTSATGMFQMVQGTFNQFGAPLGFTPADITNPQDQAQVAAAALASYGQTVESYTGSPPTIEQAYGAWEMGPKYGEQIAAATNPDEQLSQIVPSSYLTNNNLQGYTVGQYYSMVNTKMGGTGGEPLFS